MPVQHIYQLQHRKTNINLHAVICRYYPTLALTR